MTELNHKQVRKNRVIMHLDMDAFFVNVELLTQPQLHGQPIIVARNSPRSVVLSASYEARQFGVRSAQPLAQARRLCPRAVLVEPAANYRQYSAQIMAILGDITDRVEQVSVDEAFIDLTGVIRKEGNPVDIAQRVRSQIAQQLHLPSSAGISSTKFVAKMASTGSKPNGLWVVPPHRVQEFLGPLPVEKLWGVGAKSAQKLHESGIHTVAQLREYELGWLQARWGRASGAHLFDIARGIDRREVVTERVEKSIGAEHTFAQDQTRAEVLEDELYALCLTVGRRLRASGRQARSLSLKLRYSDFETLTRSCPLPTPTVSGRAIFEAVRSFLRTQGLVDQRGNSLRPVRLIGIRAERLEGQDAGVQLALFDQQNLTPEAADSGQLTGRAPVGGLAWADPRGWELAERTMDSIQSRYGVQGLQPARLLKNQPQDKG